jgi:hypothetical protein
MRRCADEPRTGTWDPVQQGECTVWYHHPPGLEQRHARHERAQREQQGLGGGGYSPECVEEEFRERRVDGVLRSSPRKYQISLICVMRRVADAC